MNTKGDCELKYGNLPCELCNLVRELGKIVTETSLQVNQLPPVLAYEKMKKEYQKLSKLHKVCAGCGLCFGGSHLAFPARVVKGLGEVCKWCAEEIDKQGLDAFRKRMKYNHDNEEV